MRFKGLTFEEIKRFKESDEAKIYTGTEMKTGEYFDQNNNSEIL